MTKGREYEERPWGSFTVLDDEMFDHKVKRIVVRPGKRLSYQTHAKRAEHWFIVRRRRHGRARRQGKRTRPGQSMDIEIGQAHRCENQGTKPVVFIEVQHGTYFGEDDIVRLEDDFGRVK